MQNKATMRDAEETVIYVKSFFHRGLGKRLYAPAYGKDAFRIVLRKNKPKKK